MNDNKKIVLPSISFATIQNSCKFSTVNLNRLWMTYVHCTVQTKIHSYIKEYQKYVGMYIYISII